MRVNMRNPAAGGGRRVGSVLRGRRRAGGRRGKRRGWRIAIPTEPRWGMVTGSAFTVRAALRFDCPDVSILDIGRTRLLFVAANGHRHPRVPAYDLLLCFRRMFAATASDVLYLPRYSLHFLPTVSLNSLLLPGGGCGLVRARYYYPLDIICRS